VCRRESPCHEGVKAKVIGRNLVTSRFILQNLVASPHLNENSTALAASAAVIVPVIREQE
jgi:hypothetical protein